MTATAKYETGSFPKGCGCGREYSEAEWERLEFRYMQEGMDAFGRRVYWDLEARGCVCKSTIAVKLAGTF